MTNETINMIERLISTDDTVSDEQASDILAACRGETLVPSPAPAAPEQWLTPREAAGMFAVSLRTIQRWISQDRIPSRVTAGSRRIPASAFALQDDEARPGSAAETGWRGCTHPADSDVEEEAAA